MNGQRKALIVASDDYEHDGLRRLLAPEADAAALAGVLGDPRIGEFDVRVVHNETAHVIQAQIEDLFSDARPEDILLLHFSCHGLKSESGELFFAARNTRPNRLASTAVPADFVQRCMRTSRSRSIVLFLDCCYGGAFGQGVTVRAAGDVNVMDSFPGEKLGGGRGRAVITASSSTEYAFEGDQLADDRSRQPSVFTAALVEGLATGEADRDEDGWVGLNELYDYVFDKVREQNPYQTPSRDVQMQGDLYLARSRRRRIRAMPCPPDLHAAMTDANMFTRLGAVSELRSRLTSDNLMAAAGALDALAEMVRNDIGAVVEPAAAALREVRVQTVELELNFGQVPAGSALAHQTIHLLGPPLARVCVFAASHSWIRVEESAEGFDVSVDTSRIAELQGTITLKGPTDELVIPVHVDVQPGSHPQQSLKAEPLNIPERKVVSAPPPPVSIASSPATTAQIVTDSNTGAAKESTTPHPHDPRHRIMVIAGAVLLFVVIAIASTVIFLLNQPSSSVISSGPALSTGPGSACARDLAALITGSGANRISILAGNDSYGSDVADNTVKYLLDAGKPADQIQKIIYGTNVMSDNTEIDDVRLFNPDAIAVIGFGMPPKRIITRMSELRIGPSQKLVYATDSVSNISLGLPPGMTDSLRSASCQSGVR